MMMLVIMRLMLFAEKHIYVGKQKERERKDERIKERERERANRRAKVVEWAATDLSKYVKLILMFLRFSHYSTPRTEGSPYQIEALRSMHTHAETHYIFVAQVSSGLRG